MAKNRLKLDFSLEYIDERNNFVKEYLKTEPFQKRPPTEEELETISNYILWGKQEDGKSAVQKKEIEIETKYSTWSNKNREIESLDELMENPNFDENIISKIGTFTPTKKKREVFDRKKIYTESPEALIQTFEELFAEIDYTDLVINYYEIIKGKRAVEPRQELLNRFDEKEKEDGYKRASQLTQREYLKLRHRLVDLRTTQYSLRDSYKSNIQRETKIHIKHEAPPMVLGEDIQVYPFGLFNNSKLAANIFVLENDLKDKKYTEEELKRISEFYWKQKNEEKKEVYFDFCNIEHVYHLVLNYDEIRISMEEDDEVANFLMKTLDYYLSLTNLSDMHKEILDMKINKNKNDVIAKTINEKYGKNYTVNYISTIFRQKIIKEINDAAAYHDDIISNIFFPENFRTCTCCGKYLLIHPYNFVRKARALSGFAGRCKNCDKEVREKNKKGGKT